jgi:glucosamine kinase
MIAYLLGIDGGGTGTRVLVARADGTVIAQGQAGPSALGQGIALAWQHILQATHAAFASIKQATPDWSACALGAGLSGVNHQPWAQAFKAQNPGFAQIVLDTDAHAMLLGAHAGQPGVIVAAGTGSVGQVWRKDGSRAQVSGWGFPVGDEGSGAWLGLRAMALTQQAQDGRRAASPLTHAIGAHCGMQDDALQDWCTKAGQFEYAQLAKCVFECAGSDPLANDLLNQAAAALEAMALALDPDGTLPLALCGSVGQHLQPRLTPAILARCTPARFDAQHGALYLLKNALESNR